MRALGFFWKVFGGTVAVILITGLGVYMVALPTIEHSLERESERRVEREALWARELCRAGFDESTGEFDTAHLSTGAPSDVGSRFTLVLPDGRVVFDSHEDPATMDNHGSRAEIREPGIAVTRFSRTLLQDMTYFALPVVLDGTLRGFSRVSVPVEDRETRLVELRGAIQLGALLAGLVSLALAGYFARRITQPLTDIAELVTEIGGEQTARRLSVQRSDEVGRLARAVNGLADDLQSKNARVDRDRAERDAILSALAGGLLAVDQDQNVLFINEQARELLGGLSGRLKGTPVVTLTRNNALIDLIDACLERATRVGGETRIGEAGCERVVEMTAVPLAGVSGGKGAMRGCVLELRDVSDLRHLESVRRDFVSNVSHELKTPLTAMCGYTEALLEDDEMSSETRRSFLEKAHKNTERLAAIVSDLLSLSRLESEEAALAFEDLELAALARGVLDDLHDLAEARLTRLCLEAPDPDVLVRADPEALGMALSNLVSNAIEYSPDGGDVQVLVSRDGEEVRIDVIDHGSGIPPHAQERVFERFYRVDKARSRHLGGTGLGLAIVRHVMASHGGRVEVESELGRGSRFSMWLPRV